MNDLTKRVALSLLAMEQQRADKLHELAHEQRNCAMYQSARGALWTIANALEEEQREVAEAIRILTDTLDNVIFK